jgi:hypothetical protein
MSSMIDERLTGEVDPIDSLIPAPRPWWYRLVGGAATVVIVGIGSFLWGFGFLVPQPDCCGSGSGGGLMSLSPDGEAVTVTAFFFNSSGRNLIVESADVTLPGAEVLDIAVLDPDNSQFPTSNTSPLPTTTSAQDSTRFLITFVPTECVDGTDDSWGTVALRLDVADWWSFGQTHHIPVVESRRDLGVLPPASVTDVPQAPLAAACALLGR